MLDACGPIEIWGLLKDEVRIVTVAAEKGEIATSALVKLVADRSLSDCPPLGLLDGRPATTNKAFWKMATAPGPKVKWVRQARWVDDGNIVTSSGLSAGMDMTLHVVERLFGTPRAERIADAIEYEWHRDASWDPFAARAGRGR